ncbi:hypothetical protein CFC21_062573, partial [Triticum aestivum]
EDLEYPPHDCHHCCHVLSRCLAWYPIGDVDNEPHVQELGGWAVAEHIKKMHDGLKFIKVMSDEEAPDAGVK